jgi:DNA-binding transcriptional MocR family regulator
MADENYSYAPKYVQIQNYILQKIESGEYTAGDKIPSEIELARQFDVSRLTVNTAVKELANSGIVERVANPYVMHIRIPDYDFLTGNARPKAAPRKKKAAPVAGVGEDFCIFWEKFHDITEHPKVNIGRARREWKKLTAGEKQRALDNIDEYYDHLNNQKYCKQAATYLADKSFENEYDD